MKIYKLFNGFAPNRKQGAEVILPMIGMAALSGVSAASQSAITASTNDKQVAANKELQEDAQEYNTQMYNQQVADQRENFNLENAEYDRRVKQQNQLQRDMMKYVFEKYSSPAAQARALEQAGINPAALYAQGQSPFGGMPSGDVSAPASSSIASPSAPTSPVANVGTLHNEAAGFTHMLSEFGNAVAAVSQSSLQDAQKAEINTLLEEKLRGMILENDWTFIKKGLSEVQLGVERIIAKPRARAELKRTINEAVLFKLQGQTEKFKSKLFEIQEKLGKQEYGFKEKANPLELARIAEGINLIGQQVKTEISKQADNYASAASHRADAAWTNWQKSFAESVASLNISEIQSKVAIAENQRLITAAQAEEARAAAELARVAASHAEAEFWKNYILDLTAGVVNGISDVWRAKSFSRSSKAFQGVSKAEQNRIKLKAQELNSYEEEITRPNQFGGRTTTRRKVRIR